MLIEAASVSKSKESEDATLGKAFVRRRLGVCACSRGPSGLGGGAYVWRRGGGDLHCDTDPVQLPGGRQCHHAKDNQRAISQ